MNSRQIHTRAAIIHLGGLLGWIFPFSFANLIGVLILWLILRKEDPFIDSQGKEALNFQILVSLIFLILALLGGMFMMGEWMFFSWNQHFRPGNFFSWNMAHVGVWAILWKLAHLFNFIFCVIAAIRAGQGIAYRYPLSLRVIK
ncbi:MAG: DUF4870 domain-containing protein [Thermoflavifilum sp.]|nr:DUF4870 domain-containing protein [Thermoflavifilum sp.]